MYEFRKKQNPDHLLGAGGWIVDKEDNGNIEWTGLWRDGQIVALLVVESTDDGSDRLFDNGDTIVTACNEYPRLLKQRQTDLAAGRAMLKQETERTEMVIAQRETITKLQGRVEQLEAALHTIAAHDKPQICVDGKALVGQARSAYDYQFFARDALKEAK